MEIDNTTLSAIATNPRAVNNARAQRYIISIGHNLELLKIFLETIGGPCVRSVVKHNEQLPPPVRQTGTQVHLHGLIWTALHQPHQLYAWNDAILNTIATREYLPGASPLVIAELRLWNAILWRCGCAPVTCAILIFWWLASAYPGVFMMIHQAEPRQSFWANNDRQHLLERYIIELITEVQNQDYIHALHTTLLIHATLHYIDLYQDESILRRDGAARSQKVPKKIKPLIVTDIKKQIKDRRNKAAAKP